MFQLLVDIYPDIAEVIQQSHDFDAEFTLPTYDIEPIDNLLE